MNTLEAERVVKAVLDGECDYRVIAERAGVDPAALADRSDTIDRAIQLMSGFYKYAHENMKPAGLPPPPNPYLDRGAGVDEQRPEYYAFEAVQRQNMTQEKCIWTCGQLGLDAAAAAAALDTVAMPWRAGNGWKSYAQYTGGVYILMDKPPVKLKRHLERIIAALSD